MVLVGRDPAISIFLVENFWDPSLFPPFTVYLSLLNVMDSVIFLAYLFRAVSEIQAGETPAGVETADGTPFRRRDAVLGVTAVSVLPFLENAVIVCTRGWSIWSMVTGRYGCSSVIWWRWPG